MRKLLLIGIFALLLSPIGAGALSRPIERDIEFPKGYETNKADAIRKVIRSEVFYFRHGLVSYWPPDWSTRLSFDGNAEALTRFMEELRKIDGLGLRLIFYKGEDTEQRRDTPWQLDFSHARPNEVTIYLNLNAPDLEFSKIKLPLWPAPSN